MSCSFNKNNRNSVISSKTIVYKMICSFVLLVAAKCVFSAGNVDDSNTLEAYKFKPLSNPLQVALNAVETAQQNHKLAMVVLGAQWCHDSRAVAAQFSKPEMQEILNREYELAFIDVGYLEDRREITEYFGYPTYFATPTVMIIEPISGQIVNLDSLPKWSSGASVPYEEYLKDFANPTSLLGSTGVQALTPELKAFEQSQAERLALAYKKMGPDLFKDVNKTLEDSKDFYALWDEARQFRGQLQKSIHMLRKTHPSALTKQMIEQEVQAKQSWETE